MTAEPSPKVIELSTELNKRLRQPLRNDVLRIAKDINDLTSELLLCNGQGTLDVPEMTSKAHSIVEAASGLVVLFAESVLAEGETQKAVKEKW